MDTQEHRNEGEYVGTVQEIARVAAEGELDIERLREILSQRHGAFNCYPGELTDTCHPMAWFVALEGLLGRGIQSDVGGPWHPRFRRWWREGYWGDWQNAPQPPYGFAAILEHFVRHLQGHCAGLTREAIILTDSWSGPVYEHWRGNIEQIRVKTKVEIYLIGLGGWQQRLL